MPIYSAFFYYDQCVSIILGLKGLHKEKQLAYRRKRIAKGIYHSFRVGLLYKY